MNSKTTTGILFFLIVSILTLISIGIYYQNQLKYKTYEDTHIVNKLGQIRGGIQRYVKLKILNKEYQNVADLIDMLMNDIDFELKNNKNLIPKEFQNIFFSLNNKLKINWENIKKIKNKNLLYLYSEQNWATANDLIKVYEQIDKYKYNNIIFSMNLIIYTISIILIVISLIFYKKIKKGLEIDTITDKLTGLYNRLYFNEIYKYYIYNFKRNQTPFSMLIIDIDNFKQINDTYGHKQGDEVLQKLGIIIAKTIRKTDLAFRYGGEEFVILFPNTHLNQALQVAERIKQAVSQRLKIDMKSVTISGGIGEYRGDHPVEFFEKIDKALYKAKEMGKNKIIIA